MAENCCGFDLGFDLNLIPETENTEIRSEKLGEPNPEINDAEYHDEDKDGKEIGTPGTCGGFDRGFDLNLTPEVNLIPEVENTDTKPKKKRGRKRKRTDVRNVEVNKDAENRVIRTRGKALVGRYVRKEFVGNGVLLGKIVFYDSGVYRIDYDDGDYQDLELSRVKSILIQETDINGEWLGRKKKLDELVSSQGSKVKGDLKVEEMTPVKSSNIVADAVVDFKVENGVPADSVKASGNDRVQVTVGEASLEGEVPSIPQPELPRSSGTVGIPEEFVSHLFSVYSFLRSFSIQLFLSPFTLDDFVGSLNCVVPNSLLDSIHVALLRALRRHIERLSSEGSELASKCTRGVDWSLLDTLTWTIYLVHYLSAMGCADGPEWKGFYTHVLKEDYYTITVGRKLVILQILCDDVLDTKEFRAEVDMREELEVGNDSETSAVVTPVNRPKRVHPRKSKTSACKDHGMTDFIGQNHEMKSFYDSEQLISKDHGQDSSSEVEDSNGDECLLCGMDGILLCCDGCPASYHARCIGICKVFMPEGAWYCPECSIKTTEPKVTRGTSLKGLDVLGIDAYGQAFVATCGHLLVLNASMNSDSCFRYYNQNDIPNVLQALQSNEQHTSIYSEICKGIMKFWELPADALSCCGTSVVGELKEVAKSAPPLSLNLLGTEGHSISEMTESEETLSCVTGSSLGTMIHTTNAPVNTAMNLDNAGQPVNEGVIEEQGITPLKPLAPQEIQVKSSMSSGPLSEHADPSDFKEKEKPSIAIPTCTSRNISGNAMEHLNGPAIVTKEAIQHRETNDGDNQNLASSFLYTGSSFKSQGYINNYLHGDFAASAAANVNSLSSEENLPESQASDLRKLISANYSLQMKAFSSVASRFFWPHTEKKLIEIPRERCTWCLSCKAPVASKRGCLLNAAASNAIKNAMKILAGLRPLKSGDGTLPSIATYIMLMEESLSGLTFGPFQAASFRKRWRRQLEQANTLSALKIFLLEFEENIRPIALSGDWLKLVDGWSAESSVIQNSVAAVGSTQKRKPGRRGRKLSITTEVNARGGRDTSVDFTWWRGSMLSMLLFKKGSLPRSLVKKAARQGGSRKIPGTYYAEGSETPKISRQLVWRAAVEMSRNLSQLALQVRHLDLHIRWNDLVRPETNVQDTKAFRNALVRNKKTVENEIRYSIAFGGQKHPPSRVMKNIIEVEKCHNGEEMYWLPETRIPLYLIKEYEVSAKRVGVPSLAKKPANAVAKLRKSHLKASRKDIFSYLAQKGNEKESRQRRDKTEKHHLSVCRLEVLLGVCEGKNMRKTRLLTRRRSAVKCWCSVCLGKNLKRRRQLRKRRPERSEKKKGTRSKAAASRSKSKRKR